MGMDNLKSVAGVEQEGIGVIPLVVVGNQDKEYQEKQIDQFFGRKFKHDIELY